MLFRMCAMRLYVVAVVVMFAARLGAQTTQTAAMQTAETQPAYLSAPKFQAAMAEARQLQKHHEYGFAADAYKKANKLAEGKCMECLREEWKACVTGRDFKEASNAATAMEALAATPSAKSSAQYLHASALYLGAGDKPKPDKLEAVHSLLAEALGHYPKNASALYLDGQVMARLGKLEEAKHDFTSCFTCLDPKDPHRLRAQHFAEDPALSLQRMAPAFEVTALDGSRFNLDAMGGHVVLIDFWATWCGPCNKEIPHMRAIAKEFAGQPFVMLSVSLDKDDAKWKDFIARNGMIWEEYRDADGKLGQQFGVTSIPRYFTIDADGVLTSVDVGEGSNIEGKLKKLIAKAAMAPKETIATTQPAPAQAN